MKSKISPIIIIVVALVVLAIGILIFSMVKSDNKGGAESGKGLFSSTKEPRLDLSIENPEENQEKVTIAAKASMDDESKIASIILPDGSEILAAEASFEVTENGEYTFKAISESGVETSNSIKVENIKEISSKNPYIPNGFSAVEGTDPENGYIIEDQHGNQFVWVPVENGQLKRDTILDSEYEESNSTASALVNSVAQNYGFYIARFEASELEVNGQKVAASMPGKMPWTNVTYQDAAQIATNSAVNFGYTDVNTAILNSYAWDTVLKWFDSKVENYSTNVNYGNYSGNVNPTGATPTDIVFNICDIAGNVREWTTEIYKDSQSTANKNQKEKESIVIKRVVRGGSANLSRTPKSHTGYPEDSAEPYWGFRLIMYK